MRRVRKGGDSLKLLGDFKDVSRVCDVLKRVSLEKDAYLGNALISFCTKSGSLAVANHVFNELSVRDVVTWNALIAGYANSSSNNNKNNYYYSNNENKEAFSCFQRMLCEGLLPNAITFCCLFKACGKLQDLHKAKRMHAEILGEEALENDPFLGSALVDMYVKCGDMVEARNASDHLQLRTVVSWTALITGYAQGGHGREALECYEGMQRDGLKPNALTYVSILKACGCRGDYGKGEEIHREIIGAGLVGKDIFVSSGLVDMYAKCGSMTKAVEVFDRSSIRNEALWNALIAGYAAATERDHAQEAIASMERMHCEGLVPNAITFVCFLRACCDVGLIHKGERVHAKIVHTEGLLQKDVLLGTALIDMYAKCGSVVRAQAVFDALSVRNVASWSALIAAYSQLGKEDISVKLFDTMIGDGVKPDLISFNIMLNACSHAGLLSKGKMLFESMSTSHGIVPTFEHHSCIVNLLGRAGHFGEAIATIEKMAVHDHLRVWTSLLGACQKWGNVELAKVAFEHIVRLDERHAAAYVCMSNIYTAHK
jgi:pentatricopeptide repeat protein